MFEKQTRYFEKLRWFVLKLILPNMSHNNPINEKKKALLAYKEKILQDIQYYDKSIADFRANHKNNSYYEDRDSSDPEDYFPNAVEMGPEVIELKVQQTMLKTCLHATQELTGLAILQSEVNILVQDPQFEGERPVTEPGIWKEVTAECRIDLVSFTITFYMHTPDRKFAQSSYRGLQVSLIKVPHGAELQKSVLHTLTRPSDAVEVVRSYAKAYRSRRTTLARLASKYANSLFMEPHTEGGFVLKCANLLEIFWRLDNKWSSVAPFHHRMKFDLEYMDESYIKIITQAHKQLLDPSIQTDERTLLLSKIITTCLEARGPVDSESDLESRQTEIQAEIELKDKDSEVMAPPKSLPKKTKKIVVKDKSANKDLTKDKKLNKDLIRQDKNTDKDLTKDKNIDKDLTKDKNTNNYLVKEKAVAKKRTVDDENVEANAKKMKTNQEGPKKVLKAKEKSADLKKDDNKKAENNKNVANSEVKQKPKGKENNGELKSINSNKKTKDNAIDNEGTKKKLNEKTEVTKKTKTIEAPAQVNKKTKLNDNTITITNKQKDNFVDESNQQNRDTEITKTTKKRKNDENIQLDIVNNDNKEIKKPKSNKDVAENTDTETAVTVGKTTKSIANIKKKVKQTKNNDILEKKTKINTENGEATNKISNINENNEINTHIAKENNKNVKNSDVPRKKVDKKSKMSIANDKKFDQITKKITGNIESKNSNTKPKDQVPNNTEKNVANSKNAVTKDSNANTKNDANNKEIESTKDKIIQKKTIASAKNTEPKQNNNDNKTKTTESAKNKNAGNTKDIQTVKKVIEKSANNNKNKDKVINIIKVPEKIIKDKPTANLNKPVKLITSKDIIKENINNIKLTKLTLKSVRNIHKLPSQKNALKIKNTQKTGNTKISSGNMFSDNTEKENGEKPVSKIPQKKMSPNTENILKKNMLRISPRSLPSKFKTISKDATNLIKNTNIPRLMKKLVPKTSQ